MNAIAELEVLAVSQVIRIPVMTIKELAGRYPARFGNGVYYLHNHRFTEKESGGGDFQFHVASEYPEYFNDTTWKAATAFEIAFANCHQEGLFRELLQAGIVSADSLDHVPTHLSTGQAVVVVRFDNSGKIDFHPEYPHQAKSGTRTSLWIRRV
jgi:hypothetical protein